MSAAKVAHVKQRIYAMSAAKVAHVHVSMSGGTKCYF